MNTENNRHISVVSGDSVSIPFACFNKKTSSAIDLTNHTIRFTVRDKDKNVLLFKDSVGHGIVKQDQLLFPGKFIAQMSKRDTYNLDGTFDYDVEFDFFLGSRRARVTGIIGKISVIKDITNAR